MGVCFGAVNVMCDIVTAVPWCGDVWSVFSVALQSQLIENSDVNMPKSDSTQHQLLQQLATLAVEREQIIATAESCTGGLIAGALTELAGSSAWFDRGFVTYSNESKQQLLGVTEETLAGPGAVSAATVAQMAQGALARSNASMAVSVSGVAGPSGGSDSKPVGTVWIAWASDAFGHRTRHFVFTGDRAQIRDQTVTEAIRGLIECILSDPCDSPLRH